MKNNFDIVKYIIEQKFGGFGDNFKYDEKSCNTFDNDYAEKYYVMEADSEWDRVDYDKADVMIRGEFWQEGGARLYDIICKMIDAGQSDGTIKDRTLKAAKLIAKKVKDPKGDGNLRVGIGELLNTYINNAKQRHHK